MKAVAKGTKLVASVGVVILSVAQSARSRGRNGPTGAIRKRRAATPRGRSGCLACNRNGDGQTSQGVNAAGAATSLAATWSC